MAESTVGSLPRASIIGNDDLFVLEQNGTAKSLKGQTLVQYIDRNILTISITTLGPSEAAKVISFDHTTGTLNLGLPRGCGISNVSKISTSGLTDTYRITFEAPSGGTAKSPIDFTLKNGRGITEIQTLTPSGLTKKYRLKFNDDTYYDLNINDGKGISSIQKLSTQGLNQNYRMNFNDNTHYDYSVHDGDYITDVVPISAPHTPGEFDTYEIRFAEKSAVSIKVYNGSNGDGTPHYDADNDGIYFKS